MRDSSFLHRSGVARAVTGRVCCESFTETLFLKERGGKKKIKKLAAVLTLSYLMDLWLCGKFCPTFWSEEVRGWGGKVCLRRPQLCDGLLLGVFPDPPGHNQLSGQSQSLTYLDGWMEGKKKKKKICSTHFYSYAACTEISHRKIPQCSIGLLRFFVLFCFFSMSGRLAINICCSPAWLREDMYRQIDACFLQYCSNFLQSHGGTQTDIDGLYTCCPPTLFIS